MGHMQLIAVPGTHAWRGPDGAGDWYHPGSPVLAYLASIPPPGTIALADPAHPFVWSTDLGGALPFTDTDLAVWLAAGENLYQYGAQPRCEQQRLPPEETVILSHSHGLQPVLVAAAKGLQIHTFVDVAGPVRKDMRAIAEAARPQIRRWVHIHAGHRDRMQWLGELWDGHLGVVREHPLADENVSVPQADHSEVLRLPQYFPVIARAVLGSNHDR